MHWSLAVVRLAVAMLPVLLAVSPQVSAQEPAPASADPEDPAEPKVDGPAEAGPSELELPGKSSEAWIARKAKWPWLVDRDAWRAQSMTERHAIRTEQTMRAHEAVRQSAQKPWSASDQGRFLVLSNCDKKFTKLAIRAASEFRKWLDREFDDASDELVRRHVLRVLDPEDPDQSGSTGGKGASRGLTLDFDRMPTIQRSTGEGYSGGQYGGLFRDQLDLYLMDKDALLYRYMPGWLAGGLSDVAGSVWVKAKKLEFRAGGSERGDLRSLARSDDPALTLREIFGYSSAVKPPAEGAKSREAHQFTKAVRYLMFGPGRKKSPTKGFLVRYMQAVVQAADELRAGGAGGEPWDDEVLEPRTFEKDDKEGPKAWSAQRHEEWDARRKAVSVRALEIACGDWTPRQWAAVEKAFAKFEVR